MRVCSSFIDLCVAIQFSQHHLLKRLSFSHFIFLPPLSKINWLYVSGFISRFSILFHWSVCLFWYCTTLSWWLWLCNIAWSLGEWHKKTFVRLISEDVLPMFSSGNLMVSCLMFKSLSHFEFLFVHGVRVCSSFIDLPAAVRVSQQHLLKRLSFGRFIFLPPLSKINWP